MKRDLDQLQTETPIDSSPPSSSTATTATDSHSRNTKFNHGHDTKDDRESVSTVLAKVRKLVATASPAASASSASSSPRSIVLTTPAKNESPPSVFAQAAAASSTTNGLEAPLSNVVSASAGAKVLFATDDWFAAAENLLKDGPPLFDPEAYCNEGKVMDGWETRRRREAGHDWCLIALSERATVVGIEIDTAHFTGNQVPEVSLEIADIRPEQAVQLMDRLPGASERLLLGGRQGIGTIPTDVDLAKTACEGIEWKELLAKTPLKPGYEPTRMHRFVVSSPNLRGNYVRVNYFPDGGVARLRLWGIQTDPILRPSKPLYMPVKTSGAVTVVPHSLTDNPPSRRPFDAKYQELSASKNGGKGVACSNRHYGEPSLLIQDTLGKDMGDGWETARHPDRPNVLVKDKTTGLVDSPLKDWAVLKLGSPATNGVARVLLDTKHFRGNFPESVLVEGCHATAGMTDDQVVANGKWFDLVSRTRVGPDAEHVFDREKGQLDNESMPVTHVRVSIFPDGGISRVRIYG